MKPKRIQLRRTKGWRLPANTVVVSRPSRWGIPHRIEAWHDRAKALGKYRRYAGNALTINPNWLEPLRGKNLACWCRLDQSCHADVLLELANACPNKRNDTEAH
jgi:hypothetical protein